MTPEHLAEIQRRDAETSELTVRLGELAYYDRRCLLRALSEASERLAERDRYRSALLSIAAHCEAGCCEDRFFGEQTAQVCRRALETIGESTQTTQSDANVADSAGKP